MHRHDSATRGILWVAHHDVATPLMMDFEAQAPQGVDDLPSAQQR
jgi:hypothetical protein